MQDKRQQTTATIQKKIERVYRVMVKVWTLLTDDSYRPLTIPTGVRKWLRQEFLATKSKSLTTIRSPKLLTLNIALAVLLNLASPLVTHSPVFADPEPIPNEDIFTDERGDALFVNKNPNFTAEFGVKNEPGTPSVTYTVTADEIPQEAAIELEFLGTGIIDEGEPTPTLESEPIPPVPPTPPSDGLDLDEFASSSSEEKLTLLEQELAALSEDTDNLVARLDKEIDALSTIRDEERAKQSQFKLKTKQQAAIDLGAENTNILSATALSAVNAELSSATALSAVPIPPTPPSPPTKESEFSQEQEKAVVVSENITTGIDLVYEIIENKGIKESIVIKEPAVPEQEGAEREVPNTFSFAITLDEDVHVKQALNGLWGFTDASGRYIAHIAKPFMVDSIGRRSNDVTINIIPSVNDDSEIQGTRYEIRITANAEWLADPTRVFPVNVDPTIIHDAQADFTVGEEQRVSVSSDPAVTVDYPTLPADTHTAGLWHLEDNVSGDGQTIIDSSANENDGTTSDAGASGMDCTVAGRVGDYACDFDGSDDFIATTYTTSIGTGPFTMEAWVKMDDSNQTGAIIAKRPGTTDQLALLVCADAGCSSSGQVLSVIEEGGGTTRSAVGTTDIADGTWHHVAVVRDSVSIRAYVDGELDAEDVDTAGDIDSTQRVTIGNADSSFTGDEFDGSIDEVAIHTRALSETELKEHASRLPHGTIQSGIVDLGDRVDIVESLQWSETAVSTGDGDTVVDHAGLVGEWLLNETSGTTVDNSSTSPDSCGSTCDGTLNGVSDTSGQDVIVNSGWTSNNGLWPASSPAALMVDGGDNVTISDTDALDLADAFTVEAWINPQSNDNGGGNVVVGKGTASYNYLLYFNSTNDNTPRFFATGLSTAQVVADRPIPTGQWSYLVGTYDGSDLKIYINGKENNSVSATGSATTNSGGLGIGANGSGGFDLGRSIIDTVRIWSRALTADEIEAHFNRTNVTFQTRTGSFDGSGDYTWEAWSPTSSETQLSAGAPLTKDLAAFWKLDEESGTRYDTWDDNDLTDNATVLFAAGKQGNAADLEFDNSEYLSITDNADISVDDDFTICAWVKPETVQNNSYILNKGSASLSHEYSWRMFADGTMYFYMNIGTDTTFVTLPIGTLVADEWDHICTWYDSSTSKTYASENAGTPEEATRTEGPVDEGGSLSIGRHYSGFHYDGLVDELGIWKRVLTAEERGQLYSNNTRFDGTDLDNDYFYGGIQQSNEESAFIEGTGSQKITFGTHSVDTDTVGYWKLDDAGTTQSDSSSNGNDGTEISSPTTVPGFAGNALALNGSSQYVSVGTGPTSVKTASFWVKPTTTTEYLLNFTGSTDYIWANAGTVTATGWASPTIYVNGEVSSTIRAGAWQHVMVTSDTAENASSFEIGRTTSSDYLEGSIDEVLLSSSALSAENAATLYRAGRDHRIHQTIISTDLSSSTKLPVTIAADRPGTYLEFSYGESGLATYNADGNTVGLWRLEEDTAFCTASAGPCVRDSSGYGNDGTPVSVPAVEDGALGRAWHFDDSDDYVSIPDSDELDLDGGSLTIAAWVKTDTDGSNNVIVAKGSSYEIGINASGDLYWDGAGTQVDDGGTLVLAGEWHHVAVTNNDTTATYYVDGVQIGTDAAGIDTDNNDVLSIGYDGTNYFDGFLDEVMIRNDVLTADEIRQLYERGKRSYPVTIDFVATLHSDDLIASSSDTSFEVDATTYGAVQQGDNLYTGDTIIVREFDTGIEYIAQGEVYSVIPSSGAVDVTSWEAQSTFPSGGFSAGATVMKWQEEWIEIPNDLRDEDADAITHLTWRVTDANQGATVWLDNLRHSTGYLTGTANCTTSCADDITSSRNRYLQYRGLLTSKIPDSKTQVPNPALTPEVSEVRVIYADTVGLDDLTTASYDTDGNQHLGSNNVNDVYFYDREQDQFSYALDFDGSNDYVTVSDDDSLTFATGGVDEAFTFEAWVKPTDATDQGIISKRTNGTLEYVLKLEENDYLRFALYDGSANRISVESTSTLTAYENEWVHIVAVYDGSESSGGMTLYLNGESLATSTDNFGSYAGMTNTSEDFYIGIDQAGGSSDYFSGVIDGVAVFSDERTATEVKADYAARRIDETDTTTYDNLVSVWHFDEGSAHGYYTTDSQGNNHGQMVNMTDADWVWSGDERDQAPLSQQALGVEPNWGNGVVRNSYALEFAASAEYVDVGHGSPLDNHFDGGGTVQGWIYPRSDGQNDLGAALGKTNSSALNGWHITLNNELGNTAQLQFFHDFDSGIGQWRSTDRDIVYDHWYHIAITYDADSASNDPVIYINGKAVEVTETFTPSGTRDTTAGLPLYIGNNNQQARAWDGYLDEIALFDDIRTASEVSADFRNRRVDDDEAGLIGLWHVDEGEDDLCSGGTYDVCDASSNNNDGIKVSMAADDWVTGPYAIQDHNAHYLKLGAESSIEDDSSYEIHLDTETTFQYRKAGESSWTTPSPATLSSYTFESPSQIDSTGVYIGFDTSNGIFSEEDHYDIHSWALESFSSSDSTDAMRGTLNRFPEKSYIVSQNNYVDILDAATNNVWMRLPQGSSYALGETTNDLNPLAVAHGKVHVGHEGDGVYTIDFTSDSFYRTDETDRRRSDQDISDRTATNTYGSADTDYALAGDDIYTVSTAVIQGQEYIATGYDESASLTAMGDQTVIDFIIDSQGGETDDDLADIVLLPNGDLYATSCAGAGTPCDLHAYYDIWNDSADETSFGENRDALYDSSSTPSLLTSVFYDLEAVAGTSWIDDSSNTLFVGTDAGMMVLQEKQGDEADGSVKQHSKDYITEEMIGDVQLMLPLTEDPANGGTFSDRSVQGNDLTLVDADGDSTTVSGVRSKGYQFDGDGDYAEIIDNASLSTGDIDFTIGAWVKADTIPGGGDYDGIISKDSSATTREYHLILDGDQDRFRFQVFNSSDSSIGTASADNLGSPSADTWYFVVAWHDATANTANIQVNGGTVDSNATTGTPQDDTAPFRIGSYYTSRHFDGTIDEVFFTKEVLTSAQRERLYKDGLKALNKSHAVDDTRNELAENSTPTDRVSTVEPLITYNAGTNRAFNTVVGTNNTGVSNDGALSILDGTSNILSRSFLDSGTEPAIVDADVGSVSCSTDGVYCIVGAQNAGITILYSQGDAVTSQSMRHGKTFGSGRERPGR